MNYTISLVFSDAFMHIILFPDACPYYLPFSPPSFVWSTLSPQFLHLGNNFSYPITSIKTIMKSVNFLYNGIFRGCWVSGP